MRPYLFETHVSFQETNLVGNVYFAQYFAWQGKCREAFLRDNARQVLDDFRRGFGMITKESTCRYMREAFAFDHVLIEMFLEDLTRVGVTMRFDYYRVGPGAEREMLAQGSQTAMWVSPQHHVVMMPDYLYDAIQAYSEATDGAHVASHA
jgi:enediyne biosynthesis thioesterase